MTPHEWRQAGQTHQLLGHGIFVQDGGTGDEAILLVHGFPTSGWDWVKIWPDLTARYRCIAPDLLGFGFSDKPRGHNYTIMEQADLMEAVAERLGLQHVHLLAHDYGDTVAQEMLARDNARPEAARKLQSICFLNGGLFAETHRARLIQKLLNTQLGWFLVRLLSKRSFDSSFSGIFGPDTQPTTQELQDFWDIINEQDGRLNFHRLIRYINDRKAHRTRWVEGLNQATCPIQLINGSLDPVSGAHMVARFRQIISTPADIVELPTIGHYPQTEAPAEVLRAYSAFLDGLNKESE